MTSTSNDADQARTIFYIAKAKEAPTSQFLVTVNGQEAFLWTGGGGEMRALMRDVEALARTCKLTVKEMVGWGLARAPQAKSKPRSHQLAVRDAVMHFVFNTSIADPNGQKIMDFIEKRDFIVNITTKGDRVVVETVTYER
jgi:hypothetical protein